MNSMAALADPTRRKIIEMLSEGERPAGGLQTHFAMSAPAVSQHLKVLREAGLVRVRIDGQRRIYSLDPDGLVEMQSWLDRVRNFWDRRLDKLEAALRQPEHNTPNQKDSGS